MYNTLAVVFFACKEKYFFFIGKKICVKNSHITKLPNEPIPQETI